MTCQDISLDVQCVGDGCWRSKADAWIKAAPRWPCGLPGASTRPFLRVPGWPRMLDCTQWLNRHRGTFATPPLPGHLQLSRVSRSWLKAAVSLAFRAGQSLPVQVSRRDRRVDIPIEHVPLSRCHVPAPFFHGLPSHTQSPHLVAMRSADSRSVPRWNAFFRASASSSA